VSENGLQFAQPWWFLGLLALPLVAGWLWRSRAQAAKAPVHRYADAHLLPHLSGTRELKTSERWGRFAAWSFLWLLLLTAMAGPRSRSMDATDVAPSRLARARQEIEDLIILNRRLRIGLIAFASVPHVIAPVTEDSRALLRSLPALSTNLTRLQGSRLHLALDRAELLLAALPADSARALLLVSDGDLHEPGLPERVRTLAEQGIRFHALGVGTAAGAEVPGPRGGALTGPDGQPVRTALDEGQLQALAAAGEGVYRRADYRDEDTRAILAASAGSRTPPGSDGERTRVWHERFYLPLLLLLALLLPRFRTWLGPSARRLP